MGACTDEELEAVGVAVDFPEVASAFADEKCCAS